jgi:hypothetical protein
MESVAISDRCRAAKFPAICCGVWSTENVRLVDVLRD